MRTELFCLWCVCSVWPWGVSLAQEAAGGLSAWEVPVLREWTEREAGQHFRGVLWRFDGKAVSVRREDGRVVALSPAMLSDADQQYVRGYVARPLNEVLRGEAVEIRVREFRRNAPKPAGVFLPPDPALATSAESLSFFGTQEAEPDTYALVVLEGTLGNVSKEDWVWVEESVVWRFATPGGMLSASAVPLGEVKRGPLDRAGRLSVVKPGERVPFRVLWVFYGSSARETVASLAIPMLEVTAGGSVWRLAP